MYVIVEITRFTLRAKFRKSVLEKVFNGPGKIYPWSSNMGFKHLTDVPKQGCDGRHW